MTFDEVDGSAWDALVVGAGPAGSLAARGLAGAGVRTLLVERAAFPRWKVCGACLNGHALASLHSAGLGALAPRLGAVPLDGFQLRFRGRTTRLSLPDGVALSRSRLDAALADSAAESGAEVLFETQAHVEGGRRSFKDRPPRPSWPVVACRRPGRSGREWARQSRPPARLRPEIADRARLACRGRLRVVEDVPGAYHAGTIFMAAGRDGYVGLVRVEDQSLNIAAAFSTGFLRDLGSPGRAASSILDESGFPPVPGLEAADWRGTPGLTRRTRPLGDDRLFLLGDAAGYVEPFTGEGMALVVGVPGLAIASRWRPLRAIEGWSPRLIREWSDLHRRMVGRRQMVCRAASLALRRPWLIPIVFGTLARWPGASGFVLRRLNAPSPSKSS